ncbi:SIR2 family protein [Bacillus cereus]|uniref:SIR2 family protein n=1 Tax=Bacillus cereus TaxID=1396 RepID=UPI00203F62AA|nr:SIR2 family protein [Bacillus cereus]MCM3325161.1 SIR2 family protein [Bacillus cereus]MDA2086245.1 SIR2 family protein [Bacillus cereus]
MSEEMRKYEENLGRFLPDLIKSYNEGSLIFFVGAGCSRIQGYPSWDEYIDGLISYWMSNLGTLIDENSQYKKVELQDINVLRNLKNSSIERKRKIDIVHQVIAKYCKREESNNQNETKENIKKFNENVLNYEKYIFIEVEPELKINPVLKELVKLECLFITTNYDNQIEKHSEPKGQGMGIYKRIDQIPDIVREFSVVHLHGTPDIDDPRYFINSSSSYSHLYLENQSQLKIIASLLSEKENLSIVFIGCSMEEEEILALLDRTEDSGANYYTFLSERTELSGSNRQFFQDVEEEFFREKRNVNVIRYGSSHKHLPVFVRDFVNKLVAKTNRDTESDWSAIFDE